MTLQRNRGFTLIELMIVVSVIAVLAAIALPIYNEQVRKSRRSEATSGLSQLALLQERWRANNPAYGTMAQIGSAAVASTFYTFSVTGVPTATTYTMTAAPAGAQTADTKCGTFTYAFNAGVVTKSAASGDCW